MDLFTVFARDDYPSLRPGALAEFKHVLNIVENEFLANSQFINGRKVSVADVHASWMIKWALQTIETGAEPGFGEKDFPKVYKWIGGFKDHTPENEPKHIEAGEAKRILLHSYYPAKDIGVDEKDPTGLKKGQKVSVETSDE
jgi:glutathione S-transferase